MNPQQAPTQPPGSQIPTEAQYSGKVEGWLLTYVIATVITIVLLLLDLASARNINLDNYALSVQADLKHYLDYARSLDATAALALIAVLVMIFRRNRHTRKTVIWVHTIYFLAGLGAYVMLNNLIHKYGGDSSQTAGTVTLGTILWTIYWLRSKRVKATFGK